MQFRSRTAIIFLVLFFAGFAISLINELIACGYPTLKQQVLKEAQ